MAIGNAALPRQTQIDEDDRATVSVAHALEQLVAVIDRELNPEAGEGVAVADPAWADAVATVVDTAQRCCSVLDDPGVLRVLIRAGSSG